jgi:adenine/guanine phosphoribosyltransferase-like PRPP-binding protein
MPSSHLRKVFDPETLRRVARESERLRVEHGADIVVVRGLSGTLAASAMNAMFGTPFAVVRKQNEISHGYPVELVDYVDDSLTPRLYKTGSSSTT